MSIQRLFAVQDLVANNELVGLFNAPTSGAMIRNHSRMLHQLNPHFENDFRIVELGYYEDGILHGFDSPVNDFVSNVVLHPYFIHSDTA